MTRALSTTELATRERLLEAAGGVFAEQGFRRATVRDICARAAANIAAVNYHFGDKERLYSEVVRHGVARAIDKYPPDMGLPAGVELPVERRLYAFIRSLLFRVTDEGPSEWHGRLMLWEMIEPTAALDDLLRTTIRPLYERLAGLVAEVLGPAATSERVRMGAASVLGQCMFYRVGRALLSRVQPGSDTFDPARVEALADHVTRISLAGLRSYAMDAASDGPDAGGGTTGGAGAKA